MAEDVAADEPDFYEGAEIDEPEISEEDMQSALEQWEEFEAAMDELADEFPTDDDFLSDDGFNIPKKSTVRLTELHPDLLLRLERAFADERIAKIARVSSGVRTYAQQAYLRRKFGPGRAANPDYVGRDGRRGSKHMVQSATWSYADTFPSGEYGYAVDVGFWKGTTAERYKMLRGVMAEYGLRLTVFRPFEPWHFELDPAMPPGASVPGGATNQSDQEETLDMQLITDPENKRQWAAWSGPGGIQHVREYSKVRDGAGTPMPGIGVIIDEQVEKGNITKA